MPVSLVVKTAATVRDDILRTKSNGLRQRGVLSPNVGYGPL